MSITRTFNLETDTGSYVNSTRNGYYRVLNDGETVLNKIKFKLAITDSSKTASAKLKVYHNSTNILDITITNDDLTGNVYTWTPNLKMNWMDLLEISFSSGSNMTYYLNSDASQNSFVSWVKGAGSGNVVSEITATTEQFIQITDENDGYPYLPGYSPDKSIFTGYDLPKPLNSWKIDANNNGYPWSWGFAEVVVGDANIFLKTENGLIPLTAYYKKDSGLIPLVFIKQV